MVCEYLMYKDYYSNSKDDPPDFQDRVNSNLALELCVAAVGFRASDLFRCLLTGMVFRLMASDYLEC